MNRGFVLCAVAGLLGTGTQAWADTAWNTQNYDLHAGDFDGDGLSDILFVAHDATHLSGIALSDGAGFGKSLQTWGSAYLGIPWTSGDYAIIVADFNGDGRADLFLQRRTPGDHYLLLTDESGVAAISQTIPNHSAGLDWSVDDHHVVAGDFNGDGRADLFLQPTDPAGLSGVLLSDANGTFTAAAPFQSWRNGYAGFNWSTREAIAYAGDWNGDGRADLLLQARPLTVAGPKFGSSPVFPPNFNGVVLSQDAKQLFTTSGVQAWSEDGFSAHWSPLRWRIIAGDFNGDHCADVILQGLRRGDPSYLLYGRGSGAIFSPAILLDPESMPTADQRAVIAGQFTSSIAAGLYFQALDATSPNSLGFVGRAGIATVFDDASLAVTPSLGTEAAAASSLVPIGGGGARAAALTVTSAGRTAGEFAVSPLGGATYQIPIWTPPGARGLDPNLVLVYSSGGMDGALGPGWALSGLSVLARCGKSYATNGGAPSQITLTTSDDICIDGNRLRRTSGTGLVAGSVYQTELANFSRVTAAGTLGNGPASFTVEGKDGLKYDYGTTVDARAIARDGTTPYAWMLNKVRDRQGNNLIITYTTTNGDIQPNTIQYTQTPATGTTYPYTVGFTYQARVTNISKFVAGGNIQQTKVLNKINVMSGGFSVRQYNLTYATAPTTQRDRLVSIQECGGSAGTDCLRPTTITYQNGTAGIPAATTATGSGATTGNVNSADINGDGRSDLIFSTASGSNFAWWVQFSSGTGYGAPVNTGVVATATDPVLIDDFDGNGLVDLLSVSAGVWKVTKWNGSAFAQTSTGLAIDASRPPNTAADFVPSDVNGDGLPDLVSYKTDFKIYTRFNTTNAAGTVSFSATQNLAFTVGRPIMGLWGNNTIEQSSVRYWDFNGDGRGDVVIRYLGSWPNLDIFDIELFSQGTTFVNGLSWMDNSSAQPVPVKWNEDACTDLAFGGNIWVAGCGVNYATAIQGGGTMAVDWDGDGRSDLLSNSGGIWQVARSLSTGIATPVSTGISVGTGTWLVADQNGDGLDDLVFANASTGNAIAFGLHNGANTPADLATTIADGWGIRASPTYVPITQNNYSKYADATFPDLDYQGPMYVVNQVTLSDGRGGTFTNSFWYYGGRVNRQGRGFEGFYATRSRDSRNNLYHYIYYRRDYPYTGNVFQDDLYQADGTSLISRTANTFAVVDLAGTGCTSATSRCFPYLSRETITTREITAGTPLLHTVVTDLQYDNFGNPTSTSTTTTDNDSASPFFNTSWVNSVTNTYTNDQTNWCLGRPTSTTTQKTAPGLPTASRRVDKTVDAVACRVTSETIEPTSTTLKVVSTFGYDTCGNLNSTSVVGLDKTGAAMPARLTSSTFGARCTFPETVTNALSQVSTIAYNYSLGEKASITDPNGAATGWTYDNFGRRVTETHADSTSTTWAYADCITATCWGTNDLRLQITETLKDSAAGVVRTRQQFFDGLERLRYDEGTRVLGVWTNTQIVYNSLGLKQDVYQPWSTTSNGYHHFEYDIVNRPISDTLYDSSGAVDRVTSMAYAGLKTTLTDAKSNATQKWADVTGKLRRIVDPSPGGTTNYVYDPFGNVVQTTDAAGSVSTYTYNNRGFRTASSDPDTGSWVYVPNSLNELVSQTDNKGQVTTFGYDKLGRLTTRLEPESATATTLTYGTSATLHEIGRLKSVSTPSGYAEAHTFDALGRPASVTYTEDTTYRVDYTYNSLGSIDTITYPTSTSGFRFALKYLYSSGYLQQVKDNAAGTVFWSLNTANDYSAPLTETLGNGVKITSAYTPWTNDLTVRQEGTGASPSNLQNLAYQWDLNGNLQQRQDVTQALTELFTYDSLNRLKTAKLNGTQTLSLNYDAAGNITTKNDVGTYNYTTAQTGCTYAGLPAQPHAVRNAGGAVYCYDKNGNMTSRAGSAITWYSFNQPNNIVSGANSAQFTYNANHQRWKQVSVEGGSTTTTYNVGGILEKVVRPSGVTEYRHAIAAGSATAIHTRRSDLTNSTYYLTSDHLGSGDLVLDSAGAVLARMSFTPFGERRGSNWQGLPTAGDKTVFSNVTRRGFTGHEMLDSVGLIHMNGRVYDPHLARFLSADPVIQTLEFGQALNPFSYVMNNPLTLIDPTGYSWLSKLFHAIGNFFKKFWRPILAIVITIVSFGYLAPIASQWLAASVCLAPGTITAAGAALAGGISSALGTIVMGGNLKQVLRSFVTGAIFAYVGFQIKQGIADWANGKGQLYDVSRTPTGDLNIQAATVPGTDKVFVNGIMTDLRTAAVRALEQTGSGSATLFYNPTHGFIADMTESFLMKVTGTSSLGNQLAGILQNATGLSVIVAHSQGTLIVSNALGVLGREGFKFASNVQITYYGAAANRLVAQGMARNLGATVNMGSHFDHFFDAVGNVLGMNTLNPFRIIGSIIAVPTLFMGSDISPHSIYP